MYAIIPAAGSGTRLQSLGQGKGKTLLKLRPEGFSLLELTLNRIIEAKICRGIVVVTRPQDETEVTGLVRQICNGLDWHIVFGGKTRQDSVYNGLCSIRGKASYALVHDAARPFCPVEVIRAAADEVKLSRAVLVATKVSSTVKQVDDSLYIQDTIPRDSLWLAQTPQAFAYDLLVNAYEQAAVDGFVGTDDCQLVERLGQKIKIVTGSELNMKVTTPSDIELARAILTYHNS